MFNFLTRNSSQDNVKSFYYGEATWLVRRKEGTRFESRGIWIYKTAFCT